MGKRLVHTPEGVRDIYGAEYASKLQIENLLHDELRSFGYQHNAGNYPSGKGKEM